MDRTLDRFIRGAMGQGIAKPAIEDTLLEAGWSRDEVRKGLDAYADVEFPIPVPRPEPYLSAREAFLYLVLFTFLYLAAWSLGSVLFELVHRAFPDPATFHGGHSVRALRWALAMLLISFPGYLALSRRSYLAARRDPDRRRSRVRKWLTYLTLFVAASTLLGDAITLLFNLLEGELTVRFVLKVVVVGGIAGGVFGYYLWDLRQDDLPLEAVPARRPGLRLFAAGVTLAVIASLVAGLAVAGSPAHARALKLDHERERDLRQIAGAIDRYWVEFDELPPDLKRLNATRGYDLPSIRDPESGALYDYLVNGESSYELCAGFTTSTLPGDNPPAPGVPGSPRIAPHNDRDFWRHAAERSCYSIEARDDERSPEPGGGGDPR